MGARERAPGLDTDDDDAEPKADPLAPRPAPPGTGVGPLADAAAAATWTVRQNSWWPLETQSSRWQSTPQYTTARHPAQRFLPSAQQRPHWAQTAQDGFGLEGAPPAEEVVAADDVGGGGAADDGPAAGAGEDEGPRGGGAGAADNGLAGAGEDACPGGVAAGDAGAAAAVADLFFFLPMRNESKIQLNGAKG